MIYVSRFDRNSETVVSESAGKACDDTACRKAASALGEARGRDQAGDGFVAAIGICGDELAEHFPLGEGKENRLPDSLIEE